MTMTQWQAVVIWKSRQKTVLKFELKWKLKQAGTWQTKLRYLVWKTDGNASKLLDDDICFPFFGIYLKLQM
jgi:hypothetical protein